MKSSGRLSLDAIIHLASILPAQTALQRLTRFAMGEFGCASAVLRVEEGVMPVDWSGIGLGQKAEHRTFYAATDPAYIDLPAPSPSAHLAVLDRRGQHRLATLTLIEPESEPTGVGLDQWLAAFASFIETVRLHEAGRYLTRLIQRADKFERVLETLFNVCRCTLRADRGDLLFYSWTQGESVVYPVEAGGAPGEPVRYTGAVPGFIGHVWRSDTGVLVNVPDVGASSVNTPSAQDRYVCCDARVRSELLLRLQRGGRRVAVLNFESFAPAWFDARDEDALTWLAESAGDQFEIIGKQTRYQSLAESLLHPEKQLAKIAGEVMKGIRGIYGFDRGLIYFPRGDGAVEAYAEVGLDRDFVQRPFHFPAGERSFAGWLLAHGPDWVENPLEDPLARFSSRGLKEFGIGRCPVLGIPLRYGGQAVGALVIWSAVNPPPERGDITRIAPFAQYAALVVATHRRVKSFELAVGDALEQMARTFDLQSNLRAVMGGLRRIGFDRVRVFEFKYGDSMHGLYSEGMGDKAFEVEPYFASIDPAAGDNFHPTVRKLVERLRNDDPDALAAMLDEGPDPHAERLDKVGLPEWVDMPLVSASKLYGELAADRKHHPDRRITREEVIAFTVFGNLAARAFAIHEKRGMLPAVILKKLYHRVAAEPDRKTLLKTLLHALTHGNGGLGFSRGLFLDRDPGSGRLTVAQGIGSVTQERFTKVASRIREWDLDSVLNEATPDVDEEIQVALDRYSRETGRRFDMPLPTSESADATECTDPNLARLLGSDPAAPPVIIPVRGGNEVLGAIVADRMWQACSLSEADRATLGTFAEIVGQIVYTHGLQRRLREEANLANLGLYASTLAHELRTPFQVLRHDVTKLNKRAETLTPHETGEIAAHIRHSFARIDGTMRQVEFLAVPQFGDTDMTQWLQAFAVEVRSHLGDQGVEFRFDLLSKMTAVCVCAPALHLALDNLVRNAVRAASQHRSEGAAVALTARQDAKQMVIEVIDNGPGVSEVVQRAVRQFTVGYTTDPERGLGAGLLIARRVAYLHGGDFVLESNTHGPGARAVLTISLAHGGTQR